MSSDNEIIEDYSIETDDDDEKDHTDISVEIDNDEEEHTDVSVEIIDSDDETTSPPAKKKSTAASKKKSKNKKQANGNKQEQKTVDTSNICRICLKRCEKKARNAVDFAEIYLKCTGFSFEEDKQPQKLCWPCINELLKVENFIEKCSETEDKLSKGLLPKDLKETPKKSEDISDVSDFEVEFEGDSDVSNFSDTIKKEKKKRKKRVYKPNKNVKKPNIKDLNEEEPKVKKSLGRPKKDPSELKPKIPKGPVGRPKGSFKLKYENGEVAAVKSPSGRPKESFKETRRDYAKTKASSTDHIICFMCGKFVRTKQISYHLWKHRKDEEEGKSNIAEISSNYCEFCKKDFKSQEYLKSHMKRLHPGVAYGMPSPEREKEDVIDDNFDKEFHVPKEADYPQIQSPYSHMQALYHLQRDGR